MGAEFFSTAPRSAPALRRPGGPGTEARLRQLHRWVSIAFTLTVAANFIVMIWRQPPAWITYSPLPPLLILLLTGLVMFGRHQARNRRTQKAVTDHAG